MKNSDTKNKTESDTAKVALKNILTIDKNIADLKTDRDRNCKNLRSSIRVVRISKGLSTAAIADIIGITQGYYSDIERGRRSCTPEVVGKLSEWLRVTSSQR